MISAGRASSSAPVAVVTAASVSFDDGLDSATVKVASGAAGASVRSAAAASSSTASPSPSMVCVKVSVPRRFAGHALAAVKSGPGRSPVPLVAVRRTLTVGGRPPR